MQSKQNVFLPVVYGILVAVQLIECAPLRLEQQAYDHTYHQLVQLLILIDRSLSPLLLIELFLGNLDGFFLGLVK